MRISTSQMYATGTANILSGQADVYKTLNQIATGRKILSPRDNPVDATLALLTTQEKEVNATLMTNQGNATDRLSYIDTQLGSVTDLLLDIIPRSVQAGGVTASASDKKIIAGELRLRLDSLIGLANSKDGTGEYIFSGNRTNTEPFVVDGTGGNYSLSTGGAVSYQGDDGGHVMQVGSSQTVETSRSGQDVFMRITNPDGSLNGRSVFDALQNMIDTLDPASGVVPAPDYNQALDDLKSGLSHILRVRTGVGAQINQVESLANAAGDTALQFDARLAKLEGVDYVEAISRLNEQKTQLEAAQQSFAKVSQLSLFNFIS